MKKLYFIVPILFAACISVFWVVDPNDKCGDNNIGVFKTSQDYLNQKLSSLGGYRNHNCYPSGVSFKNESFSPGPKNKYWGIKVCENGIPTNYRLNNQNKTINTIYYIGDIVLYGYCGQHSLDFKFNKDSTDITITDWGPPYGVYASKGLDGEMYEVYKAKTVEILLGDDPAIYNAYLADRKDRRPIPVKFFHYALLYNKKHKK
jgi:hypothetical protein